MTKTNWFLGAWLALFCAIFWAGYLFGNTAPWFDNVAIMTFIGLWGMGNALITAYPALSFIYLFTLVKRTIYPSLVIAGIIAFVWGFYPWLIPVEVGSGITMVMLLIWSTLFLVYRPAKTFLLKIEGAPAWVMDNKEMTNKKTPYGWVEVIETATFNQPASTWFGERHNVIIPIYWGMSDEVKQAISQYAAQLKQADQVYLGLFVDDVFEKGQKLLGFQTKPNSYLDDIESWLLHLLKNANTKAKKEQVYLFGASIKQLMPTMQELGDKLNPSGILFFAAPKTHSPLAQLANRASFSQWQIDGAQAGLASVNHAISTIEQPKQYPTGLLLKPALVQTGAAIILALPLLGYQKINYINSLTVSSTQVFYNESVEVSWETNVKKVILKLVSDCDSIAPESLIITGKKTTSIRIKSPVSIQLTNEPKWWWPFSVTSEKIKMSVKEPKINKFLSSVCQIEQGHHATLTWQQQGAQSSKITDEDGNQITSASPSSATIKPSKDMTYYLSARPYQCAEYKTYLSTQVIVVPLGFVLVSDTKVCNKKTKDALLVAKYELTNQKYNACVNDKGCEALTSYYDNNRCIPYTPPGQIEHDVIDMIYGGSSSVPVPNNLKEKDSPVVCISWEQATQYANWKSKQEHLEPCYANQRAKENTCTGYRLPSLKEWEYIVKDFTLETNCKNIVINAEMNPGCGQWHPWPVGQQSNDQFKGIYDLYGNIREWTATADIEMEGYCEEKNNSYFIVGDSWVDAGSSQITASKRSLCQNQANVMTGVRLVRNINNSSKIKE